MKKNKTLRILFVTGSTVIALIFIFIIIKIYDYTLNDAKKNHQIQQLEMAKAAASGIGAYLNELIDDMHLLSNYPGIKRFDKKRIKMNADLLIEHYNDKIVKTIFVLDGEGRQVYYTGSDPQASSYYGPDFELSKMRTDETRFFRIEPFYKGNAKSGLIFVMLMPFEQERKNKKLSGRTGYDDSGMTQRKGYIGLIVSFDFLIHKYIVPLKLGEKDFAWIMDGGGRLIYHPRHKDMLLRSINGTSSNCLKCHSSFDVQRKMIRGNSSYDEYTIGNEAPKIMAYVPISLNGDKWILAISTFLPEVTASLREKFVLFFGLGILILFVILSLGALLYFQTTKKIRAEESNRHMEQRQSFQDQLSHAGKLASIGELVDSVAHEINTPLGIITSYIDALKLQKDYPLKYAADFDVIKNQTKRINNYTKSLLNYSHRIPFNPKPEELTTVLEECLFLLNPLFQSKKIRITKAYEHNLPKVEMDKRQIEQVFINLFNNAADAIVNNGNIKIQVSTEVRNISVVNKEEIKYAAIAITDNGRGIEPGDVSNIFESFFTTKREGKGTGLGLSISKAIILRHKGKIEVLSEPGKITTFRIFLPINNNNKGQSA